MRYGIYTPNLCIDPWYIVRRDPNGSLSACLDLDYEMMEDDDHRKFDYVALVELLDSQNTLEFDHIDVDLGAPDSSYWMIDKGDLTDLIHSLDSKKVYESKPRKNSINDQVEYMINHFNRRYERCQYSTFSFHQKQTANDVFNTARFWTRERFNLWLMR